MDDYALRENKGYWVKVRNIPGTANLSIPAVGGSLSGQTYDWSKLRFSNETEERNITLAGSANWLQASMAMYSYNSGWIIIDNSGDPETKNYISSWEGIWVYVKTSGINLIRRNQ